jgi:hypothetical protein
MARYHTRADNGDLLVCDISTATARTDSSPYARTYVQEKTITYKINDQIVTADEFNIRWRERTGMSVEESVELCRVKHR